MFLKLNSRFCYNFPLLIFKKLLQFRENKFLRLLASNILRNVNQVSAHFLPHLPMKILAKLPQLG
jgi:hypothetical protein